MYIASGKSLAWENDDGDDDDDEERDDSSNKTRDFCRSTAIVIDGVSRK